MLLAKTLRSSTYKLALVAIGVFGAFVIALFAYVRWSTVGYVQHNVDREIGIDLSTLTDAYVVGGRAALVARIGRQRADPHFKDAAYLLVDPSLTPIAGNLDRWPALRKDASGPAEIAPSGGMGLIRVTFTSLPNGDRLLVGRKVDGLDSFIGEIDTALGLSVVLVFVLAAAASVSVTQRTVSRIEAINATSRAIMQSGLDKRIPLRGSHDEWDELAANLNIMLERIQLLMSEVKQATDNVAHDLRTPLARMRGRLEKARLRERDSGRDQLLIEDTIADLEDVLRMFMSLVRISQIEAYDISKSFRRVNLAQIADEIVELFDAAAEKRNILLQRSGDSQVMVNGDRDLLFDAIANVVDNALKYGPDGGRVGVETREAMSGGMICVVDNGPGIPEGERQNVFKRFYRLERSRASQGNGLGLSLVSAVARLHGAVISLSDNFPGLTVQLSFPPLRTEGES
ncbi:HAMP domain-containing histidine kinase (plasmid) [Methylocystis sp. MJC1]|uniref:sensor histidine kinase n=2 Tax=Methylocystis sp. MJC1 TaxID=2654282 RepID=UPI001FEEA851|nr:HAMP domain-containing sensor histidine kinase [Methylocystis sp. MJC1]KAF2991519.1 Sensor kinase CusS [Methylocystis sp. MJC1]UZX13850.1 HAMP domain-containing histidine kinase [Methylocystis sp. MJC1]